MQTSRGGRRCREERHDPAGKGFPATAWSNRDPPAGAAEVVGADRRASCRSTRAATKASSAGAGLDVCRSARLREELDGVLGPFRDRFGRELPMARSATTRSRSPLGSSASCRSVGWSESFVRRVFRVSASEAGRGPSGRPTGRSHPTMWGLPAVTPACRARRSGTSGRGASGRLARRSARVSAY